MNNSQLGALLGLLWGSRRNQNAPAHDAQQLDVIESVWYNQKQKLPLPWRVFIDSSQEELEREMRVAVEENRKLSSWRMARILLRQFSESGALHWALRALYPLFARNIELLIDGIIAKYSLFEWLAGFAAGMILPKLRNHPFLQHQADKMEVVGEEQEKLPVVPKIFATTARLGFMAGLFILAPSAIPSIIISLPVPSFISQSNLMRLDLPSMALKATQLYVALHQGVFSAVRLHRHLAPKEPVDGANAVISAYPKLPIDLSTPEARRQIQLVLPVYISDRTLEKLIQWGPIVWREATRLYRIHFHFWPLRAWQRQKFRGSLAITTAEVGAWIYFSRTDETPTTD